VNIYKSESIIQDWRFCRKFILLSLVLIFVIGLFISFSRSNNSDYRLISIFYKNKSVFEKIQRLAMSDPHSNVCFGDPSIYNIRCPPGRQLYYHMLISELPARAHVQAEPEVGLWVNLAHGGLLAVGPTWYKGIVYLRSNAAIRGEILASLDHASNLPPGIYYRQIDGNWFLYYNRYSD
jgi:hypothetical protein